ncbi:MAG TPA: nitroreductase [Nitrospiraceae bacterium]|jgi:SagB-type dehydrogenase family enzyme|nr:nitroreductase [Nitrospiraceae bacterium]
MAISEEVIQYHDRTKHHPHRYAKSPDYLDWANEPDPFRRYDGVRLIPLPLAEKDPEADYLDLYERKNSTFQAISLKTIGTFLELSLGLSAWKSFGGASWALRINPSSGNLHPTEAHLILPPWEGNTQGGVYHYNPFYHALEQRATPGEKLWAKIREHFLTEGFFVALTSIYWRESWKYGERAYRYCNHDAGHAAASLSFSGTLLGWNITYLNALSDQDVETVLGFHKTRWKRFEEEHPDFLLFVHARSEKDVPREIPLELIQSFRSLSYSGEPNPLSNRPTDWHVIEEVSSKIVKPRTQGKSYQYRVHDSFQEKMPLQEATKIIRRRRSAVAFDGKTYMPKEHFFGLLEKTIPRNHKAPFDLELGEPSVHLLVFAHRVTGLQSGLYFLFRHERDLEEIKQRCHSSFLWKRVDNTPESLLFYLLKEGDFRSTGQSVSCHQEIAADGALCFAMIARFKEHIEKAPFLYRTLHWEAGLIGQILYLEAEACSLRGTGMGCFFDDAVHEVMGFSDNSFQDLYHFGIGEAVEDLRLVTLPPYHHLAKGKQS